MKLPARSLLAIALAGALILPFLRLHAAEPESGGDSNASGVVIEPHEGNLETGSALTITFPAAMVKPDAINVDGQACPFVSDPKLSGTFLWKSETEGEFVIGKKLIPGAHYHLSLDPGLKDAAGKPFADKKWKTEFTTADFIFSSDSETSEHLHSQPQVSLTASYPVSFNDALEHIYFQDRDSREKHPVQVVLSEQDAPGSGKDFKVEPREPLPEGRAFDVIVDGVRELNSQQPLSRIYVFPSGSTAPMKVKWVAAQHFAGDEKPQIVVNFSDRIPPGDLAPDTLAINPPVKNLHVFAEDDEVIAEGDYDVHTHYSVTIPASLKGARGYGLAADSKWGATFRPMAPAVLFPGREIFERSGRGLRFAFFQVNAPKLSWKLAPVPPEKLAAISARIREFERNASDPFTGQEITDPATDAPKPQPTELLADAFHLNPVGSGDFDASGDDKQVMREINWRPGDGKQLTGAYLLEVSGKTADGKLVGNRSLVCFSDLILTQKRTDTVVSVRVAKMSDGMPVPGVTVHLVTESNVEIDNAVSDKNGLVSFSRKAFSYTQKYHAHAFIADTADGPAFQFVDETSFSSGSPLEWNTNRNPQDKKDQVVPRSLIVTDRNLYRPAQTVQMKGILRLDQNGKLSIPAAKEVHWSVTRNERDEVIAEGNVPLTADGSWAAHWEVPQKAALGEYVIHCDVNGQPGKETTSFRVEEYRVPLFSAEVETRNKTGAFSEVKISSAYFHGAPNRGARVHWKASWETLSTEGSDNFMRYDNATGRDPKVVREPEGMKDAQGDAVLDANGTALIKCDLPFTDGVVRGRCLVVWHADITSIDGQTLAGGTSSTLQLAPKLPGIRVEEQFKPERSVKVDVDAVDADDKPAPDLALQVDLYHVTTKTAKEKIAPFVYRYRDITTYAKVGTQLVTAPGSLVFPVKDTGNYTAVATAKNQENTPPVSADTDVSGVEPAEFPVQNETSFQIKHEDRKFLPGEKAVLHLQAPFGGMAWVSVETDEILGTLLVPVEGNSGRIELPIKKEYGPNAFVSVYLVKPGGGEELARERFAYTSIDVRVPERELQIIDKLEKEMVRPGESVRGELTITSEEKPVADADVLVFAADDAVLRLGDWTLPDLGGYFYPERRFGVLTYSALEKYIASVKRESLTEKGFVIGGVGEDNLAPATTTRKEFRTLAYWQDSLRTDADGKVKFDFEAPDNLTSYRIVAVAQTKKNQFGEDDSALVKISKPLIAEPALPRFLRNGDEVELRVVARQKYAESDEISVRCVPDAHLQLTGPTELTQSATKDAPSVFRFKAKVVDPDFSATVIRFDAASKSNKEATDSVQNTIPVVPPVIVRKESVAGTFEGPKFDPVEKIPDAWKKGHGDYDLTISTSPWLPKITGLPLILDYPHGCFDQVSSRMLSYGLLGDLLAYLPNSAVQDKLYRSSIENGLKQFKESVKPNGMLPYWNGNTDGNPFCTIEACWALNEINGMGFESPVELMNALTKAVQEIALGHEKSEPFEQCFALMVLSQNTRGLGGKFAGVAQNLYLKRGHFDDETRAMLALAMHQFKIMPAEKAQLMSEIGTNDIKLKAFNPVTFSSTSREEAIRALAFCKIAPANWTPEKREQMKKHLLELMDSSVALSTQENLWLLLAFKAYQDAENLPKLQIDKGNKAAISRNGASAGWLALPIPPVSGFAQGGLNTGAPLSYLMSAKYMSDSVETDREDHGFRVERVVRNLTDAKRTGAPDAPFKLGDQIYITYRMFTRKLQNYVAVEDQLPAGLEVVNPDLPMIGKFFSLPVDPTNQQVLGLSHSEMRDQATLLYFYQIDPGSSVYSVLARATAAGTFRWPSTQVAPMYDSRFTGTSPSSLCVVTGD